MEGGPDFDTLFAARGGTALVVSKLAAYAITKIEQHKGIVPLGGHATVAQLDAHEVVNHAFERSFGEPELWDDGEKLYQALRRHIDNHIRTLAKSKKEDLFRLGEDLPDIGDEENDDDNDGSL